MKTYKQQVLKWQEHKNGITLDCSLDVAITQSKSGVILLIIPGVDGSVDGYESKYKRIAEMVNDSHGAAVVRVSNPFISSFHWQSNVRRILEFIQNNTLDIAGKDDVEIRVMAHSAGASVVAQVAYEYPIIAKMLLVNPAAKLGAVQINEGLNKFQGKLSVMVGSDDPNLNHLRHLEVDIIDGADHYFSGKALRTFIDAPSKYLFG